MTQKISDKEKQLIENLYRMGMTNKEIAKQLGISPSTIYIYTKLKERGFKSRAEYMRFLFMQRGFKNQGEYQNYLAIQRGFPSLAKYQEYQSNKRQGELLNIKLSRLIKEGLHKL
ncbi:MAG: helix-turn-helix domain-containing protein [Candidatus Pacearchaeota archaeon]